MQTYDLLMLLVLVGATIFGFWKGMAWQIASLASLVVSYFAALRFSEQLAPVFGQQAPLNRFAAMLAIYSGTSLVVWTLFRFVSGAIDKVRLESFDKQMGGIFGLAKGVLLCVAITFFAVTLLPPQQGEAICASQSGHYIVALLDKAHSVFPPEVHQVVDPYLNKIEQKLNPNYQPHNENIKQMWPTQAQATLPADGPQSAPPQAQYSPQQFGWPQASETNDGSQYGAPREPNPFPPTPYSAEVPASRDY
jgi:membrane protein required for colicin V production